MGVFKYSELKDTREFAGEIVDASVIESKFGGEQIEISIEPLDHEIKGESGAYHEWYPFVESKTSKWGVFLGRLDEMGEELETEKDLIGKRYLWEECTLEELGLVFDGGSKDGEIDKEAARLKTIRLPKDQIDKNLKATGARMYESAPAPAKKSSKKAAKVPEADFSELEAKLLDDGFTRPQINKWAKKQGIPKTDLDAYIQSVQGNLEEDEEDGTITLSS